MDNQCKYRLYLVFYVNLHSSWIRTNILFGLPTTVLPIKLPEYLQYVFILIVCIQFQENHQIHILLHYITIGLCLIQDNNNLPQNLL